MPPISRPLTRLASLDRSFEGSRYQERFLATAFEAALPVLRRRPERTGPRREHPATPPDRLARPAAQGG